MALLKDFPTSYGTVAAPIVFASAYHRIIEVTAKRMFFPNLGELDSEGNPLGAISLGARITTAAFATAEAAAAGAEEVGRIEEIVMVPASSQGALIAQAYDILKTAPGWEDATDA
jgi:hypothetical protein